MALPDTVSIVEVGPRDGLQNEPAAIPLAARLTLLDDLAAAGLTRIETGSFVNPRAVPQMADSDALFAALQRRPGVRYAALTPNLRGLERAIAAGADEVAVFAAASESFSHRNLNCSIAQSLERFAQVCTAAAQHDIPVRGYASCVLGCPLEGAVAPRQVADLVGELLDMGCYEISLGDTIGTGTPGGMQRLLEELLPRFGPQRLAVHCHDTYGQALANILVALQAGIGTVDASVSGLGGCPFAPGATGNVATEDVVYMLHGMGIECGVDMDGLLLAAGNICRALGRPTHSRAGRALAKAADA